MFRVYGCVVNQHDFRLVLLAGVICLFACYTAFSLLSRARALSGGARLGWLGAAAVVTGSGVWATHFVAMLAFHTGVPTDYDLWLTAFSVAIAIALSGLGFVVAVLPGWSLAGGAIIGAAVGAMHFVGMAALRVPALKYWDMGYVSAALALGIGLAAPALWSAVRSRTLRDRATATGLLTLAICGLHFTAMAALRLDPDPTLILPDPVQAPQWMALAIFAVTMLIVGLGLIGSIVDEHLAHRTVREAHQLRQHVLALEATKLELEGTTLQLRQALDAAAAGSQAKSQFLATMSHELRTPLNAIIGFSEILSREMYGPLGDRRYQDYAQNITDSGSHLLGLINDVLDFSKLDAGHLELQEEPVDLTKVVADTVRMIEHQAARAGLRLTVEIAAGRAQLLADERRIRQVLLNLLSNAVKFTPQGGRVGLSVSDCPEGVTVAVTDSGIGMAAEDIPKALDPFGQIDSRLARKYEGTGLGLPLSKRLIELHGGSLTIDSAIGVGTTVTVTFPAARRLAELCVA